ncbi:hypothetical protein SARC_11155 [Sphaeroforma arctica JP610]|uniref:Uncharacterized protein n=1 Tax=Sphaeroforma arctica JP610 TaxID=667725 RepID=A0A0L0FJW9_9EUKA|nr:hypothetical protein SARC_11155 [Sphaeroforma arctica JP610]KNC76338.1 hypothetical protein SARC_11155 [Sphaeroforma arctica JP610]|eukprot:XP_014150240.1 hypothetical protein SARC_11155 [Sphaeroforma arctica JP610]
MMDATDTQGSGAKVTSDVSRAIVTRLSEFVDNEIFVPLFSASELARFGPAQRKEVQTSMERRCCAAVKIALNALQLGTYASVVALRDVVVDDILNKHLIPAWEALGPTTVVVSLVIKIANALPADWLTDLTKLEELSQLYKFRNCVNTLYIESNRRANEAIDNTELGRVRALLYDVKL